jgi:hypothetical protein
MYMKTNCFFTIATALGLSLSLQAQQPGPDQDRPKDSPPPVSRPDAKPDMQRRDSDRSPDRGPGPQARPDMHRPHQHAASGQDRDAHIREALKHLREAGLGHMAQRIEQAIGQRRDGHDRRERPNVAEGRRVNPQGGSDARRPEERHHHRHPRWAERGRRDSGNAFAAPQRIPNPRPDSARSPEQKGDQNTGMEELRGQMQRLTREVEALKNALKQRTPEPAREQIRRPDEPRREERRDGPPGLPGLPGSPREERRDG